MPLLRRLEALDERPQADGLVVVAEGLGAVGELGPAGEGECGPPRVAAGEPAREHVELGDGRRCGAAGALRPEHAENGGPIGVVTAGGRTELLRELRREPLRGGGRIRQRAVQPDGRLAEAVAVVDLRLPGGRRLRACRDPVALLRRRRSLVGRRLRAGVRGASRTRERQRPRPAPPPERTAPPRRPEPRRSRSPASRPGARPPVQDRRSVLRRAPRRPQRPRRRGRRRSPGQALRWAPRPPASPRPAARPRRPVPRRRPSPRRSSTVVSVGLGALEQRGGLVSRDGGEARAGEEDGGEGRDRDHPRGGPRTRAGRRHRLGGRLGHRPAAVLPAVALAEREECLEEVFPSEHVVPAPRCGRTPGCRRRRVVATAPQTVSLSSVSAAPLAELTRKRGPRRRFTQVPHLRGDPRSPAGRSRPLRQQGRRGTPRQVRETKESQRDRSASPAVLPDLTPSGRISLRWSPHLVRRRR